MSTLRQYSEEELKYLQPDTEHILPNGTRIRLKHRDSEGNRIYDCPLCKIGEVKIGEDVFYGQCDNCKMTLMDYKPLPHQEDFHKAQEQYKMQIGGFASGKTTGSCAELAMHALGTPNGRSLITAPTLSLVRDAVLPELEKFLPPWYLANVVYKPSPRYLLNNGHEILVYASNDQEKLRSLNLTAFYIEEASGVDYSIFDQLMTRLRHQRGIIRDDKGTEIGYKYLGIISTNPEEGWIRDKFLMLSNVLKGSPSIDLEVYERIRPRQHLRNRHYATFISSTRDNHYKPREFIERMTAGKSIKWIRKYVDCYLDVQDGAVYPDAFKHFIEPFRIPDDWDRVVGFDFGYRDPTAWLIGAIDPKDGVTYFYKDYSVTEQPVSYHADNLVRDLRGVPLYFLPQADPSIQKRSERDGKSYKDYFYDRSKIVLEPANNDINYGIEKVRDYMYCSKLKFFNNLEDLKTEFREYAYKLDPAKNTNDKPKDAFNHLMDCLRYIVAKLPPNPFEMEHIYVRQDYGRYINVGAFGEGDKIDEHFDEAAFENDGIHLGNFL